MATGITARLSALRKEKGISQKEAAAGLGVSQALLSHYENGIRECGLDFLCRRIAEKDDRIFFIPLQKVFDSAAEGRDCAYWIWDGIHPTESGHALIAREWIKAFKAMFE